MCLAIPGKILDITDDEPFMRSGRVGFNGIKKKVSLAFVPDARVGDYVLVHAGLAISVINEDEAQRVFDHLQQIDELGRAEEQCS